MFFDPRSIFDPVMRGQNANFRKIDNYSTLHEYTSKTIRRSDIKLSPACSPFNSEQKVPLPLIHGKFVTHSIPERSSVTLSTKSPEGKLGQ